MRNIIIFIFFIFCFGCSNHLKQGVKNHCVLDYEFKSKEGNYSYCLNPVDINTGEAIKFSPEDEERILCINASSMCNKIFNKRSH